MLQGVAVCCSVLQCVAACCTADMCDMSPGVGFKVHTVRPTQLVMYVPLQVNGFAESV